MIIRAQGLTIVLMSALLIVVGAPHVESGATLYKLCLGTGITGIIFGGASLVIFGDQ